MRILDRGCIRLEADERPTHAEWERFSSYYCGNCLWYASGSCESVKVDKLHWKFPHELACSSYRCRLSWD